MALFKDDPNCIKQREYLNIPAWNSAGYTGKGLVIFHNDVEKVHSECCADIIQTILPDALVLEGSLSYQAKNNKITECTVFCKQTKETLPFEEFIARHNVSQINASVSSGSCNTDSAIAVYLREMIDKHNLVITCSNGNSDGKYGVFAGAAIMCSGAYLTGDVVKPYGPPKNYTDFCCFMGFQSGTSFSAPFINGMAGLLRSKYGRNMTQQEIYQYFKAHSKDLGEPGRDPQYGHGVPILGDASMEIKMKIGDYSMVIDGKTVLMDEAPVVNRETGRTLVPIRAISEALGCEVRWNKKTKEITILK